MAERIKWDTAKAFEMRMNGATIEEIAKAVGADKKAVQNYSFNHGWSKMLKAKESAPDADNVPMVREAEETAEEFIIKDSGERTEFDTGAVRDMHEGKGRFDLMPMSALLDLAKHCEKGAAKYGEHNIDKGIPLHSLLDSAMRHLVKYLAGWNDEDHLTAACWNLMWALNQRTTHPELNDLIWSEYHD